MSAGGERHSGDCKHGRLNDGSCKDCKIAERENRLLAATFIFPRPGRLIFKRREMPRCHHTSRPDCENVGKALFDCLTGIIFRDDAQICELCLNKVYASGSEQPGVEIEIRPL